jgi:hypothetical protein
MKILKSITGSNPKSKAHGLRGRLALSTALATVAFSYAGRTAYAGACAGGGGIYSCSGAAGADTTQTLNPGSALTVTTDPGFGITTAAGNALSLTGVGGLSFTDNNNAAITGAASGLYAANNTSGAVSITSTGTVTGSNFNYALQARNTHAGPGNLTVNANNIDGGIRTSNSGSGDTTVTVSGAVTSGERYGIRADSIGGNVTVTAGAVTSTVSNAVAVYSTNGHASANRSGPVSATYSSPYADYNGVSVTSRYGNAEVTTSGTVTVSNGIGVSVVSDYGLSASATVNGAVIGASTGVVARTNGAGASTTIETTDSINGSSSGVQAASLGAGSTLSVTASGAVTGGSLHGIFTAITDASSSGTVTLNSGASVSASSGTAIYHFGAGALSVTVSSGASVTGGIQLNAGNDSILVNGGDVSGVTSFNGGAGTDSLSFQNVAGSLAGGTVAGIENFSVGTGGSISLSGTLDVDTLTVQNGGSLGGSSTINAGVSVDSGGAIGAGNSPGQIDIVGNLDLAVSSTTLAELGGVVPGTQYDRIDVSDDPGTGGIEGIATLAAGAIFDVDFIDFFTASLGEFFDIIVADDIVGDVNTLVFDFTGAALGAGLTWQTEIVTFGGTREALRLTVTEGESLALPEPTGGLLLGLGLAGLMGMKRRKQG